MGVIGLYPDRLQSTTPRRFSFCSYVLDARISPGRTFYTCGNRENVYNVWTACMRCVASPLVWVIELSNTDFEHHPGIELPTNHGGG